jgi:hypothetical protein
VGVPAGIRVLVIANARDLAALLAGDLSKPASTGRFGVGMGKGWTFDQANAGGVTTQLDFSRENGRLGNHVILRGRGRPEEIRHIRSSTGQSLSVPAGATILIKLSATTRDAATPADLEVLK